MRLKAVVRRGSWWNRGGVRSILEPMAPRGAIVRADDARHTITLSGNGQDIAGMMEAISIFDVDVMRGMSFALVPVWISDPAAIAAGS